MDDEIKHPSMKDPKFFREAFDYRSIENAGQSRGVGDPGKVGLYNCTSYDPMPPDAMKMKVPRDHEG